MKTKSITTFMFFAFAILAHANSGKPENKGYKVEYTETRGNEMNLNFTFDKVVISDITIDGVTYSKPNIEGGVFMNKSGYAALPIFHASVQLPNDKNVDLQVENGNYTDYKLSHPLLPSRGTIYRNQDPKNISYQISAASIVDQWYPLETTSMVDPFIIRDIRGTSVYVHPMQYNAVKNILRVYSNISVKLIENNTTPVNPLTVFRKAIESEMFDTYQSMFINFGKTRTNWTNEIGERGDILVLYTSRDATVIQPYISWKKQMGYKVTGQQVATGTNVKSTISTAYASNPNLFYVLLVGDWADIKSDLGSSGNGPMDPMMGCVVGTDKYPDIIVGRFSANSTADVTTQVNKTISYEKLPTPGGTWYKAWLGVASDKGPGDDNELDYQHIGNIWTGRLSKFTYSQQFTDYDPGATAAKVTSAVNSGVSSIDFSGDGAETGWAQSNFSNTNVNALTNGEKLPFIFSVSCVVGSFHTTTCFAETWLRKSGGGAVAMIGSTINQPWNPPMIGQDYMNDLLVGGHAYSGSEKGSNTDHGETHYGSIVLNGTGLMYTEDNSSDALDTKETWTIFADPSLQVRTDIPKAIVVSNPNVPVNAFTTNISVGGQPFQNALVSIWDGTNQPFSGYTDASGNVTVSHTLTSGSAATLTVTGFNLIPFITPITIGLTSVNNFDINNSLQIYPNPSNGKFELNYTLINKENSNIKIVDMLGNLVYSDLLMQNAQSKTITLNNVKSGLYFLSFENNNGRVTKKITIEK